MQRIAAVYRPLRGSHLPTALLVAVLAASCGDDSAPLSIGVYDPPITFNGLINGKHCALPGKIGQPNRCTLTGDTVFIFMCSEDYVPSPTPKGAYMRLVIYPGRDTGDTTPLTVLGTTRMLMKYGDHSEGTTQSYQVTPADTAFSRFYVKARVFLFARRRWGGIHLGEFEADARPIFGTNAVHELEIRNGTIRGSIQ